MSGLRLIFSKSDGELAAELRGFPDQAVQAARHFRDEPSAESLCTAAFALLEFYLPRGQQRSLASVADHERLREDLGVDSLSLAEATFKMEELFGFAVETRDLTTVLSAGDLRRYLAGKFSEMAPT